MFFLHIKTNKPMLFVLCFYFSLLYSIKQNARTFIKIILIKYSIFPINPSSFIKKFNMVNSFIRQKMEVSTSSEAIDNQT